MTRSVFARTILFFALAGSSSVVAERSPGLSLAQGSLPGSMSVSPSTGTIRPGSIIDVNVNISGGGTAFNAAQATVTVSNNLHILALTPGNCGFTYIVTPTIANPSFVGATLGSSTLGCTVYTLSIQGAGSIGAVSLTDAELASASDASELLGSVQDGCYTSDQPGPLLSLSPYCGPSNTSGAVIGGGFAPGEPVKGFRDGSMPMFEGKANADGLVSTSFSIKSAGLGVHSVTAIGQRSGFQTTSLFYVNPSTSLKYGSGRSGLNNELIATGFQPGETVQVRWAEPDFGQVVGSGVANSSGTVGIPFTVPTSVPGAYRVNAIGLTSGATPFSIFNVVVPQ